MSEYSSRWHFMGPP